MGRRSAALHESGTLLWLLSVRKMSQCSSGLYGIKWDGLQETPRSNPTDGSCHRLDRQGLSRANWNVARPACLLIVLSGCKRSPATPLKRQCCREKPKRTSRLWVAVSLDFGPPFESKSTRPRAKWLFSSKIFAAEALRAGTAALFCPGCPNFPRLQNSLAFKKRCGSRAIPNRLSMRLGNSAEEIESMPTFAKEAGCGPRRRRRN